MKVTRSFLSAGFLLTAGLTALLGSAQSQQQESPAAAASPIATAEKVPVMDGGAGPCSLELTVTANTKPVAAANVKVHIAYGFVGVRKLDLEAYTNNDGKLKFTGLPARVKRSPLEFRATKDKLAGIAVYDPETECDAKHELTLVPQKDSQN
jgi:hypothetical protein